MSWSTCTSEFHVMVPVTRLTNQHYSVRSLDDVLPREITREVFSRLYHIQDFRGMLQLSSDAVMFGHPTYLGVSSNVSQAMMVYMSRS